MFVLLVSEYEALQFPCLNNFQLPLVGRAKDKIKYALPI